MQSANDHVAAACLLAVLQFENGKITTMSIASIECNTAHSRIRLAADNVV